MRSLNEKVIVKIEQLTDYRKKIYDEKHSQDVTDLESWMWLRKVFLEKETGSFTAQEQALRTNAFK